MVRRLLEPPQPPQGAAKPAGVHAHDVLDTSPEAFERREPGRGRAARTPCEIPAKGWTDIWFRVVLAYFGDRVGFIAGGVTFFTLLALFPGLTVFVSLYGLFNAPETAVGHVELLRGVVPAGVLDFLSGEVVRIASAPPTELGVTLAISLGFSLWSANAAVKWLVYGLNVAYHETEKRNFFHYNLLTMAFTAGALVFVLITTSLVVVTPVIASFFGLRTDIGLAADLRWPLLFAAYVGAMALLYRHGPCRARARWRWLTLGGAFAAVLNLAGSAVFSWWLSSFADYARVYGSLGAAMGFMMWTWLSITAMIMGAELNAEMEHQTAWDTTTGRPKPMGERGALVADTVGPRKGAPGAVRYTLQYAEELSRRLMLKLGKRPES
ncbi:YihY/virulence factor BrkB family protein [Caulobacter sp. 17J80-11]|nr:YihY/virulence factor BrkB family protein [Caulobacter sp. 17J80-11]